MNPIGRADGSGGKVARRQSGLGEPWRQKRKNLGVAETLLTFQRKLGVRLPTLLPALIFGGELVVLIQG